MPVKHIWPCEQDALILRLRGEGMSWDAVGEAVGVSRWTARERGGKIGAKWHPPAGADPGEPPESMCRRPYPPGHPMTWGAINAGTTLAGVDYPLPVFL